MAVRNLTAICTVYQAHINNKPQQYRTLNKKDMSYKILTVDTDNIIKENGTLGEFLETLAVIKTEVILAEYKKPADPKKDKEPEEYLNRATPE